MDRNTYDDETYLPNNAVTYVEEFVKPTFRITLSDSKSTTQTTAVSAYDQNNTDDIDDASHSREIMEGDSVQVGVSPSYYFGGVMTDTV